MENVVVWFGFRTVEFNSASSWSILSFTAVRATSKSRSLGECVSLGLLDVTLLVGVPDMDASVGVEAVIGGDASAACWLWPKLFSTVLLIPFSEVRSLVEPGYVTGVVGGGGAHVHEVGVGVVVPFG